jgi:apolipoprotein N-acyltransferase
VDPPGISVDAQAMGKRSGWVKIAAAVISGLLVAGLFPPFHATALVWVALVPLLAVLWSVDGKRAAWKGFGIAWLAGTASCLVQFNWLAVVSPLGALLLPMYLGIYWGVFGAFAATIGNPWRKCGVGSAECGVADEHRPALASSLGTPHSALRTCTSSLRTAFCHAALWAGLEWLRGWLFTGFGWNGLGVAFHETLPIAQAADLLGVCGLAMVPVFFQAVMVQAGRRLILSARDGKRRPRWDFGIAAAVVGLVLCYGLVRMAAEGRGETVRLKTLLVQINIPQDAAKVLWSALEVHMAYEDETIKALEGISESDAERLKQEIGKSNQGGIVLSWPDWVMWPESALTGVIFRADDGSWATSRESMESISQVRKAGQFHLIFGVNEWEADATSDKQLAVRENGHSWNSLAAMTPDNELQTYRKHHLVIFGETIPFVDSIPLLKMIYEWQAGVPYRGSFTPGTSFDPLPIATAKGTVIGAIPTVCFEDSVPRLTRRFVREGPQVIVNVTNDGWFKESAAAAQHFANARFRAIELRRPMLRSANSGVSAAVDSIGSTVHPDSGKPQVLTDANGSHFTRGSLLAELDVPLRPSFSLYAVIGDWGVIVLALLGVAWAFATRRSAWQPSA